jgi:choline dehydrogenase-like flavoprotein
MEQSDMTLGERSRQDVIIIGSGAGGSSLAYELSQHGLRVVVIERGDFLAPDEHRSSDAVGKYLYHIIKSGSDASCFVGGETKFYGAALYRMRESDFTTVEHENGMSPSWPINYSELEPYYQRAEQLYHVHGAPGGDANEPRRAAPFPHPPIEHAPIVAELVKRMEKAGIPVSAIPRGLDYGPKGKCVLCSTCDGHYCQIDAKMDAEIAALRPAIATGNVQLMTNTNCVRVLTTSDGSRATGVLVQRFGREQEIRADAVAVCAGIRGSASLLRRSRTQRHPEGLGNTTGCLGRYLGGHSAGMIFPLTGWKRVPQAHTKTFAINAYYDGAPGWNYPCGVIQISGQMPFWEEAPGLMRPLAYLVGTRGLMCFYMTEALPTRETGFAFEGDEIAGYTPPLHNLKTFNKLHDLAVRAFRRAGYPVVARRRMPRVWHEVGTTRFGADQATSVVDVNCQVHGIEGLFVVDASVLPSAGAVNTGLTIVALALRAGDHISRRLQ